MPKLLSALFPILLISLLSCSRNERISLNPSDEAALDVEHKWAVVSMPYVVCRESPSYDAPVSRNLRRGALEKIVGEKTVRVPSASGDAFEKWYAFEFGWVPENSVEVYLNRLRAEKSIAGSESEK